MKKTFIMSVLVLLLVSMLGLFAYAEKSPGLKPAKVLKSPVSTPSGLAWDGSHFWVADRKTSSICMICPKTGKLLKKIPSPGYWPSGLAWDGSQLWVSDLERRDIYRIDPKTSVVTHVVDSPVRSPYGLAWDGKLLWVLDSRGKELNSIDPNDGTTIVGLTPPAGAGTGMTFDGEYLWVADRIKDEIYMVCPKTGSVINVIHAPGKFAYGLAWDGKYLWNIDYQSDKIYALDVRGSGKYYEYDPRIADVTLTAVINNQEAGTIESFDLYFAVPPKRAGQKLLSKIKWSPEPTDFKVDKWDQKVAHFRFEGLEPGEKRVVTMKVRVKASAVRYLLYPDKVTNDVPSDLKKYLVDDAKYDYNNPFIQKLVKKVVGSETNLYWKVRKMYDYLLANMYYEMVGGWNTAPTVIKRGNGSCSEYTFSLISLCRAVGIPARYVGTIVVRGDDASWDQVYHRWAEVYMPGYGWIDVDASRGDKPRPADQGRAFGGFADRFLVTTRSGGGSEYLDFNYNYNYKYTAKGKVNVRVDIFGEWDPVKK